MPIYRDKNNNPHTSQRSCTAANVKIDADHVLRTFFLLDDGTRVMILDQIDQEHVNVLTRYIQQRNKQREAATEAVEDKKAF